MHSDPLGVEGASGYFELEQLLPAWGSLHAFVISGWVAGVIDVWTDAWIDASIDGVNACMQVV